MAKKILGNQFQTLRPVEFESRNSIPKNDSSFSPGSEVGKRCPHHHATPSSVRLNNLPAPPLSVHAVIPWGGYNVGHSYTFLGTRRRLEVQIRQQLLYASPCLLAEPTNSPAVRRCLCSPALLYVLVYLMYPIPQCQAHTQHTHTKHEAFVDYSRCSGCRAG